MTQYRFLTPKRRGKWYDSLREAQARANAIGAGFLDGTGTFIPYRGTILEMREKEPA
ncbi:MULTISPECIES: hypothetical protein [Qipengyuania]|uniref:Uncharacterized protein n=1 Tax=Qipengyuania soli TaxID=2782568 RepID=A0A7S8IV98_9SPHN|nr:hypothetical protein [Qipengyuania soli]QPC99904.1 hypothetical protein IRL76_05045 [Qipengyuania soli]